MEKTYLWVPKEGLNKKDSLDDLRKDRELSNEESSSFSDSQLKKLIKRANSSVAIAVNIVQSLISKDFFPFHGHSHYQIPKNMMSVDEKYLRCCQEFIHMSAFKGAGSDIAVNSGSTNIQILPESLDPGQFIFECPMTDDIGSVVISTSPVRWSLSSVTRSKSVVNILSSPLFHQFGASDKNENLSMMNYTDTKGLTCYDYMDSPSGLSISSSYKLKKETPIMKGQKFGSMSSVHERLASTSSTNSDGLSFASPAPSQGMLQCTWREGIPQFVFSADDKKEIYVANLMKVGPKDNKALDHVYLIHLDKGEQKGREISDSNSQLVGKVNVSTSFTLDSNNDKIMETEFVLFGDNGNYEKELYGSSHTQKRNKGLSRKLSNVFKSPLSKHTTLSKFDELQSCPWDPHANSGVSLLEANIPANFETAAIVVKDQIPCTQRNKAGGWGLKFLNKFEVRQTPLLREACTRSTGDCSTSMNILIPAGIHGGPRARNGGPSSLIDRWRSGGLCDCGGWDEGCPLTIYQTRSTKAEVPSQVDMQEESKNVDLVPQGSRDFTPALRMVSIRDNLYFIQFRPPLSALQSFSIAVAIIHTQSPILRSNSA
ncbi:uncharacterized protein LOC114755692 [Neltuma alba]|uniref:uncharacterized protein LOC114755692 n=1 Tax=Neltuma alba TaxID=207710 RepID=UPI0010A3E63A|nr:uncharacterized protein LOC114755692 [Prosopis alba]XP_028800390.1 uncharacterized protein LOC114755692 [Prosopis alba]